MSATETASRNESSTSSTLWNDRLDDVDFNYYHDDIIDLMKEFNSHLSSIIGSITYETFLALILKRKTYDRPERVADELLRLAPTIGTMKISRLDFIALMPLVIYIESSFNCQRTLFRFREQSMLDRHMRQAAAT